MTENSNLQLLKKFDASFTVALLKHSNDAAHELKLVRGLDETLEVDGLQLTSRHNRKNQTQCTLKGINLNIDVHVFGVGLGDEIKALAKDKKFTQRILVHVLCPKLLLQLTEVDDDFASMLQDKVRFILDENLSTLPQNRICILPELSLEPGFKNSIKAKLTNALNDAFSRQFFENSGGQRIKQALMANAKALEKELPLKVSALPKAHTAVVIASGPSLESSFDKIQALKSTGALTIAADTALAFLEKKGVIPDLVVSIDDLAGAHAGKAFMRNLSLYRQCTLLYAPWSNPKLWQHYPGPRFYLPLSRALKILPKLRERGGDNIWSSGSVMHAQVALAICLQAQEVYLAGVNLCYDGEYSHAGLKKDDDPFIGGNSSFRVLCNDGQLRPTLANFLQYQEDLELYIANHPKVSFKNLAWHGAKIQGCTFVKDE